MPCSAASLEYPSAPDNVHIPLTAAAGGGLGHQQVGTPKIKWTVALMMIMLAQVRPALGVIDVNPFLQEALALSPTEARPAVPVFSNIRKRDEHAVQVIYIFHLTKVGADKMPKLGNLWVPPSPDIFGPESSGPSPFSPWLGDLGNGRSAADKYPQ